MKPGTKIRFDRRYKKLTVCKPRKRKEETVLDGGKLLVAILAWITFSYGCWMVSYYNNLEDTAYAATEEVVTPTQAEIETMPQTITDIIEDFESKEFRPETIEEMITRYFPENPAKAIRIARCESKLNPLAYNGVGLDDSHGIFQINIKGNLAKNRPTAEQLKDPETNIKFARTLYDSANGFQRDWIVCNRLEVNGKLK